MYVYKKLKNMKKIFAKSGDDVLLIDHSRGVKDTSLTIFNRLPEFVRNDESWRSVIEVSSLLHDIGKSTATFQRNLKNGLNGVSSKNKYRHNEIGWAFCYRYLNVSLDILTPILYNIYWHHGISNKMNNDSVGDILKSVTEDDIKTMKGILVGLLGEDHLLSEERDMNEFEEYKTPLFYYKTNHYEREWPAQKLMLNRIILISADQLQSKFESKTITSIEEEITRIIHKNKPFDSFDCPQGYDLNRHNNNIQIAKDCSDHTTIINGPGGMGKTDIGVHWNSLSDKKFIIVNPMNLISQSVYNNIENINKNYDLNLNIQLFLTGEIMKSNSENSEPFDSDITVTNIDNFIRPSVDDKSENHIERLLMLLFCDVQIDEYHELVCESRLFSLFIIIMRMRHYYTDSRTLLTSATPIPVDGYWNTAAKQSLVLPEVNKHYPAPHDKKYKISVHDDVLGKDKLNKTNTLVIFNSIKEAQFYKKQYGIKELIHSDFIKKEVDGKLEYLYENYGKQSPRTLDKPNVIGTRIIQTSIDMSFSCLVESVCSPQDTFQRIPRVNRWGDYQNTTCELKFFKFPNSKSENGLRNILYTRNLSDNWFDELKRLNGQQLTLDELNAVYNNFNKKYGKLVSELIKSRYSTSIDSLTDIYPIRFNTKRTKSKIVIAGSNKLRTNGNEIMVTAKEYGKKTYCDPICQRIYSTIDRDFHETPIVRNQIIKVYKEFVRIGDPRFEVNDILDNQNKITLEGLRREGIKSNTPYVRFDKQYHHEYGMVELSHLDKILSV